jgi:hypothetical protein
LHTNAFAGDFLLQPQAQIEQISSRSRLRATRIRS